MKILVKRTGALGDVLDVTPVTHRLRQAYPGATINIMTAYPQVFYRNRDEVNYAQSGLGGYDRVIDLDGAFEKELRRITPVQAYMKVAFGDMDGSSQLHFDHDPVPKDPWFHGFDWSKIVVFHAARSWPQRTLPQEFWQGLAETFVECGYKVACTGTGQDWPITGEGIFDFRDQFDLRTQASMIAASRLFVCSESGPMVLAQCTQTPIVCMFTMSRPWMMERERNGVVGWKFHPIESDLECRGCQHTLSEPVTFFNCLRGDNFCVTRFKVTDVFATCMNLIEG